MTNKNTLTTITKIKNYIIKFIITISRVKVKNEKKYLAIFF